MTMSQLAHLHCATSLQQPGRKYAARNHQNQYETCPDSVLTQDMTVQVAEKMLLLS